MDRANCAATVGAAGDIVPAGNGGCGIAVWTFTENYAVQRTLLSFDVFWMENLLWVHKEATKRSVNLIPIGTRYAASLNFSDGNAEIVGKQKRVDELLVFATARSPWVVNGYSDELAAMYKKSRDGFAAEVLKQKKEMGRESSSSCMHL